MTLIRPIGGILLPILLLASANVAADEAEIVKPTTDFSKPEKYEVNAGGAGSVRPRENADAFSQSSANLSLEHEMRFKIGNGFFKRLWVSAPASTQASDGLGPLFNARSCQRCHLKDGRGHPPENEHDTAVSMFLRLSIPPQNENDEKLLRERQVNVIDEPTYGGQLQDFAIQGIDPEGKVRVSYTEQTVKLADGTIVSLREPTYSVADLNYGPMHPDVMLSPRVAPQMIGLGLLEMISANDITSRSDPDDKDGDGISGRANMVWDSDAGKVVLGRFGWKAGNPTVRQQSGGAFAGDIGISNPVAPRHYGDCTGAQAACRSAPSGASPQYENLEAPEDVLELVTHYSRNLAVPQRRDVGKTSVLRGKKVFYESGCISCHAPKFITRTDGARPEHSRQLIWPYTDLLLHDMGEGLADGRPEGAADGYEWRTPPLWGIGLTKNVSGHTYFLHDGRARNLLEAILWHGGEAEAAKNKILELDTEDRNALIEFLESL